MEATSRKHLRVVAGRPVARPPATPEEIEDSPHHDVLVALGRIAAGFLILLLVVAFVLGVFSLVPVPQALL